MRSSLALSVVFVWFLLPIKLGVGQDYAFENALPASSVSIPTEDGDLAQLSSCDCISCTGEARKSPQKPWSLFGNSCRLKNLGIKASGYIQQSYATDSRNPTNPGAGFGTWPGAGFLFRNDEYLFNRLYFTLERPTDTSCYDLDFGGKIDILYGTDYAFLQSRGLETRGDFSAKWNSASGVGFNGAGLMGLALPQIYGEVAYRDTKVKLGHFYHPGGYTGFDPVKGILGNTNTYTLVYNSILPVTGGLAEWKASDRLTLGGGVHRGSAN